jgi:hypothetical protein
MLRKVWILVFLWLVCNLGGCAGLRMAMMDASVREQKLLPPGAKQEHVDIDPCVVEWWSPNTPRAWLSGTYGGTPEKALGYWRENLPHFGWTLVSDTHEPYDQANMKFQRSIVWGDAPHGLVIYRQILEVQSYGTEQGTTVKLQMAWETLWDEVSGGIGVGVSYVLLSWMGEVAQVFWPVEVVLLATF